MSVQSNIKDIKDSIAETSSTIKADSKVAIRLRSDYGILEHDIGRVYNENLTEYMHKIYDLEGRLKKLIHDDTSEVNDIKAELVKVIKEKILLQEGVTRAATKISHIENIVGYMPDIDSEPYNIQDNENPFHNENEEHHLNESGDQF